jgi:molybdate transport system regulatory protein
MKLSVRNQLSGIVESVQLGEAMAVVKVTLNGNAGSVSAAVTRGAVEELALAPGAPVTVLIKATEVMLATD